MAPASSKIEYPKHFYNAQVSGDRSITAYAVLISILKGLGEASDLVESLGLHPTSFLLIDKAGKERICNRIVEGANKLTLQFNAAVKIAAPIRNEFGYNYAEVELFTDEPDGRLLNYRNRIVAELHAPLTEEMSSARTVDVEPYEKNVKKPQIVFKMN